MSGLAYGQRGDTRELRVMSMTSRDRFIPPTEAQIAAMEKSLGSNGQLSPIIVTPVTRTTYRIVAGATRHAAACNLHWERILATIVHGSSLECRLVELTENLDRKNITGEQRKALRDERRRLIAEHKKTVEPSEGGRGKKGGMRQAARDLGVSEKTVRRVVKLRPGVENAAVSLPAKTKDYKGRVAGIDIKVSPETWQRFNALAKREGKSATEKINELIDAYVAAS